MTLLVLLLLAIEPKVTRAQYNLFSDQEALVLGKRFVAETDRRMVLLNNPGITEYLQLLVGKLGAQTQRPELVYRVKVVDSPQINAFSLPGGYIYIYRGLLDMAWNESELVGMLAHELSHVVARHNLNRLSRRELTRGAKGRVEVGAVSLGAMEGTFSRAEETEADLLGFYTMLRAGWDPAGMISAFEGIRAFTGDREMVAQMWATHPPAAERSRYLTEELEIAKPPSVWRPTGAAFQLMKNLLRELPPPRGK